MGNSASVETTTHTTRRHFEINQEGNEDQQSKLEFFAELNILSKVAGYAQWLKVFTSITKFTAILCELDGKQFCRVVLFKDGVQCGIDVPLPAQRMKMTSECFLQWRDKQYGGAWGLNFVSDKDALSFQNLCQVHRSARKKKSSLASSSSSVPTTIAPPPSAFDDCDSRGTRSSAVTSLSSPSSDHVPRICSPDARNQSDSGIGQDIPSASATLLPSRFSPAHATTNGSQTPSDMDPIEYDYLRRQATLDRDDVSPDVSFNGDLGSSLNASRNSLYVPPSSDQEQSSIDQDAISYTRAPSAIVENRQIGATRKTGWLVVKSVLIHAKKGKLELASNRRWKKYWVALKGIELLFYHCDEKTVTAQDLDEPTYKLDIDSCLVQAIPEHSKMNNVFSLSTKYANVYFLQSTSQVEVENWIHCVLSTAGTSYARQKGNGSVEVTLATEIDKVDEKVSSDGKLKKMAELQLTVVEDAKSKQNISDQITEWERSLESLHVDMFRLRCYVSSIDGSPLPNPQSILTAVSKHSKQALVKLGIFSVASFHAYVVARQSLSGVSPKRGGKIKRNKTGGGLKSKLFDSLRIVDNAVVTAIRERHSPFPKRKQTKGDDPSDNESNASSSRGQGSSEDSLGKILRVQLPGNQSCVIQLDDNMTVDDVISITCSKRHLTKDDHFLVIMSDESGLIDYVIPASTALIQDQKYSTLRLCPKVTYSVELEDPADYEAGVFGLGVSCNADGRAIVTSVDEASPAMKSNIIDGDEVVKMNGVSIGQDLNSIQKLQVALRNSNRIKLELLSRRLDDPSKMRQTTESLISFLVCPPPPRTTQVEINDAALGAMIIPPPCLMSDDGQSSEVEPLKRSLSPSGASIDIDELLGRAEEVNIITREMNASPSVAPSVPVRVNPSFKLRKVIIELIDTEKTYLKNLCLLLDRYLIPMKEEEFLAKDEADLLVGNVSEIYDFQTTFLESLEQTVQEDISFEEYSEVTQFQNVVYSIGETFLEYSEKFKLYSTFCSCHSRAVKLLELESNAVLQQFLEARNPKQQHSGTLESYLITPIQRVLRYPLLMKSILKLLNADSAEHKCMSDALTSVENVADYINEMQRISETFTPHFQEFCQNYDGIESSDVGVDNLLHYGRARMVSSSDDKNTAKRSLSSSGKLKKDFDNELTVFVFKKALILMSYEQKMKKKAASPSSSVKAKTRDEIKLEILVPISNLLIRDHAWSDSDSNYLWEIVDTSCDDAEAEGKDSGIVYTFVNGTGEEKRVFVNALKEATKYCNLLKSSGLSPVFRSTDENSNISSDCDKPRTPVIGQRKAPSVAPKPKPRARKISTSSSLKKLRSIFE